MDEETRKALDEIIKASKPGRLIDNAGKPSEGGASAESVDFKRRVSLSEVKSTYLNLTDATGRCYGGKFPPHKSKLMVIDGNGRKSYASMHHTNQIWGSIQNWFAENGVKAGDVIRMTYDPSEREEGYPVIHLEPLREEAVLEKTPELAGQRNEASEGLTEIPFTLEKQIEDVLERDVSVIEPGLTLFESEGRRGRQYPTDVGIIDLLCRRPNGDFVVVELKRGRASDAVVGQISRYMGWVKQHIAEGQNVYGIILAPDADDAMHYAVSANPNIRARYLKLQLEICDHPPD
jgi:hypothetical protein